MKPVYGSVKTRESVYATGFFDKLPALVKESDFVLYHLFIMEGSLVKSPLYLWPVSQVLHSRRVEGDEPTHLPGPQAF